MIRITATVASAFVLLTMSGMADARGAEGMGRGPAALPAFSVLDADGDGKISKAELEGWWAARRAGLDADGDGVVTLDEFKAQARARADEAAERAFARLDGDGDGKVAVGDLGMSPDRMARGLERMLSRVDANDDGVIDQAEYDRMLARMAERGPREGRGDKSRWGHGKRDN